MEEGEDGRGQEGNGMKEGAERREGNIRGDDERESVKGQKKRWREGGRDSKGETKNFLTLH